MIDADQNATGTATTHPINESKRLSVSDWRISRLRLPPRAARTENSRCLDVVRASCRLARFTHAINRTKNVVAMPSIPQRRSVPRLIGATRALSWELLESGYS